LSLIEKLSAWGGSNDKEDQVFWLHDKAGTGKSSLVAHMAKHWRNEGVLAARFFFDRNGGREFRSLGRLCVTLAKELAENQPLARTIYLEMMEKQSVPDSQAFSDLFSLLVISVAGQLSARQPKPLIFVIDALDECFEDELEFLTSAILNALPTSKGVRFLLTSRPIDEITSRLDGITGVGGNGVVLLDVKHGDAERDHDTSIYVRHRLKDFSVADQTTVIECARGVFLWASLACDTLLRTVTPSRVLTKFQNNTPNQTLQTLYEAVLEAALPPDPSSQDMKLLHAVLQGVTLTYSPVSIFAIQSFFPSYEHHKVGEEEYVEFFVKKLGSIMRDGTPYLPIYILHPTFREFIESQKNGAQFYISPPDGHYSIAVACLAWLAKGLTPNVLGLDDGKSPLESRLDMAFETPARLSLDLEAPLRYAVAFWATHASLALGEDDQIQQLAMQFFTSKFLEWVEWSSAIQELPECIDSLRRLQSAIAVQEPSEVVRITKYEDWKGTDCFIYIAE
jgi:AAA ATPase domain